MALISRRTFGWRSRNGVEAAERERRSAFQSDANSLGQATWTDRRGARCSCGARALPTSLAGLRMLCIGITTGGRRLVWIQGVGDEARTNRGILLMVLGILTLGTGAYFSFLRPALLPEDLRFTGADPRLLDPRMAAWLRIVFRTWRSSDRVRYPPRRCRRTPAFVASGRPPVEAAAAVLVAFGRFLVSNLQLRSDHLPFIAGLRTVRCRRRGWPDNETRPRTQIGESH